MPVGRGAVGSGKDAFARFEPLTYATVQKELTKAMVEKQVGRNGWAVMIALCHKIYADGRLGRTPAAEISERINAGEGTVGKLLSSDPELYNELRDSVAAFKKACEQVKLPENMDKDVADIMNGAKELVANLTEVSEKLKNGEGTLGKLATR